MKVGDDSLAVGNELRDLTFVKEVPVTVIREPYVPVPDSQLKDPGTPRANFAADIQNPQGTLTNNWRADHQKQTVLQQHLDFFDTDHDMILWPGDTFRGLRRIGWNLPLCVFAVLVIHGGFSYPTVPTIFPDPFFRIYLNNIHKVKHGSDTGSYDTEGRWVPQKFEDFWSKYGQNYAGEVGVSKWDLWNAWNSQRVVFDPFGWSGSAFEWVATYIALWPEDGILRKEEVRGIYDGSIWIELEKKEQRKKQGKAKKTQ